MRVIGHGLISSFVSGNDLKEKRNAYLKRPETFVKALAEGLVAPVENPVASGEVAECRSCGRDDLTIHHPKYQLCGTCRQRLQYHGETVRCATTIRLQLSWMMKASMSAIRVKTSNESIG